MCIHYAVLGERCQGSFLSRCFPRYFHLAIVPLIIKGNSRLRSNNMIPTFYKERKLWHTGYRLVAGVDEVGRGAWAGPVVVGAVIFTPGTKIAGVRDSKLLTGAAREKIFPRIVERAYAWAVGAIPAPMVDRIGITASVHRAMIRALEQLSYTPDHVLTDNVSFNWRVPCTSVADGDTRVTSIAAASIIAKVWRDRFMTQTHTHLPVYGFDRHKGYGTASHERALRRHGLSTLHRRSFVPDQLIKV